MDSLLACRIYSKLSRALLLAQRNLDGLSIDQKNTSYAGSIRLNYPDECEEAVNKQINVELNAYYAYQGLVSLFKNILKFSFSCKGICIRGVSSRVLQNTLS